MGKGAAAFVRGGFPAHGAPGDFAVLVVDALKVPRQARVGGRLVLLRGPRTKGAYRVAAEGGPPTRLPK
eukprot:5149121-Lingulodinium_polyedra.AAC.1